MHVAAPARLYLPASQITGAALVDPGAHEKPALQFPEHAGVDSPDVAPYVPPGHWAVHAAVDKPGLAPYVPAGHGVHDSDARTLKVPTGQIVGEDEPAGQA